MYHLTLHNAINDNEELWLFRAGKPIQNLTDQPDCAIEGTGRTTEEYSLLIRSGTTSNKPFTTGGVYVYSQNNTIVINGLQPNDAYLVFDLSGRLFTNGKATGNVKRIYAVKGTYIIYINGNSYKTVVN